MEELKLRSIAQRVLMGRVAALARSHINGTLTFERTIEQTTGTMFLAPPPPPPQKKKVKEIHVTSGQARENIKLVASAGKYVTSGKRGKT